MLPKLRRLGGEWETPHASWISFALYSVRCIVCWPVGFCISPQIPLHGRPGKGLMYSSHGHLQCKAAGVFGYGTTLLAMSVIDPTGYNHSIPLVIPTSFYLAAIALIEFPLSRVTYSSMLSKQCCIRGILFGAPQVLSLIYCCTMWILY